MTRAEWDALTPREKDAVVAEKVMGLDVRGVAFAINPEGDWSVRNDDTDPSNWMCAAGVHPVYRRSDHYREPPTWEESPWSDEDTPEHRKWFANELAEYESDLRRWGCHHHDLYVVPFFTTSWDAMREVVEKMEPGFWVRIRSTMYGVWLVKLGNRDEAIAPTLPEAVSIAALTALGHMEAA